MQNAPNFGRHLEFRIVSKTVTDKVISSKFWALWELRDTPLGSLKIDTFPYFDCHLEF